MSKLKKMALVLFGVLAVFTLLEAVLNLWSAAYSIGKENANRRAVSKHGEYTILCIGESTTDGQYPTCLSEMLNDQRAGKKFRVIDKGLVGTTTDLILSELDGDIDKYKPDIVVAMIGINDWRPDLVPQKKRSGQPLSRLKTYQLLKLIRLHVVSRFTDKDKSRTRYCIEEAKRLRALGEQEQAEEIIASLAREYTGDYDVYIAAGLFYRWENKYEKAADMFKKAVEYNPKKCEGFLELGKIYRRQGAYEAAESMFLKVMELDPKNIVSYSRLWSFYTYLGRPDKAEDIYLRMRVHAMDHARIDSDQETQKIIKMLEVKRRILQTPNSQIAEARGPLKTAMSQNALAARRLNDTGKTEKSPFEAGMIEEGDFGDNKYYHPATQNNYIKIRDQLASRGIKLIAVQYPLRELQALRDMLYNDMNVIFVDNEASFREAVKREGYWEYFTDRFAGDFGHCTEKGNRLLASNIADAILKAMSGRESETVPREKPGI